MLSVWCCLVFFYWPAIDLLTVCLLPGEFLQAALSMMDSMGKTDIAWRTFKTVSQNQSHAASWSNCALWERPLLWRVHLWGFIAFDIFWSFYFFYLLMSVQISHADYPRVLHCKFPTRYHCTWRRKNTTFPQLSSSDSNLYVWSYFRSISFITYQKWKQKARGLEIIGYGLLTRPTGQTQVLNRVRSWKPGNL